MATTKAPNNDEDLVNKMGNPPQSSTLEDKGNGSQKPKDKSKDKSALSEEIKKAISNEIGRRLAKADKKHDELSKQLEQNRTESKDDLNRLSQEVANLAKLFKPPPQEEQEYLNACGKQEEMEVATDHSSLLDEVDDDEESVHYEDPEHDIEQHEGSLIDGLQSYKISKYVLNT